MPNTEHKFLLMLKVDGKTVATRENRFVEYNDRVVYSLRIDRLMRDMQDLISEALKDSSINQSHQLVNY